MPKLTLEGIRKQVIKKGPVCTLNVFLRHRTPAEVRTFRAAMADETLLGSAICAALNELGYTGMPERIRVHRRRSCVACFSPGGVLA